MKDEIKPKQRNSVYPEDGYGKMSSAPKGRLVALVLLTVILTALGALDPDRPISGYRQRIWNQSQGLTANTINLIVQDRAHVLWMKTVAGLIRFDGHKFEEIHLADLDAQMTAGPLAIVPHPDEGLWIGTLGGILLMQETGNRFYTAKQGLTGDQFDYLYIDDDKTLWVGSETALHRLRGDRFQVIPGKGGQTEVPHAMTQSTDGTLWCAGKSQGLFRLDPTQSKPVLIPAGLETTSIHALAADRSDRLWLGTRESGLLVTTVQEPNSPERIVVAGMAPIMDLLLDRQQTLWVATIGNGLLRLRQGPLGPVEVFKSSEGLIDNAIRDLFEDEEGNLWLGSNGSGLACLSNSSFITYGPGQGLPGFNTISVFAQSNGRIWTGTQGEGAFYLQDNRFHRLGVEEGLRDGRISAFAEYPRGVFWIGTFGGGLHRLENGKITHFSKAQGLTNPYITALWGHPDHGLWAGTAASGLYYWDKGRFIHRAQIPQMIVCLAGTDAKNIWAGTERGGLYHVSESLVRRYTAQDGIGSNDITSLAPDSDGRLWIGTLGRGIVCLENDQFYPIGTAQGLWDDKILAILLTGSQVWCNSSRGIFSMARSDLLDVVRKNRSRIDVTRFGLHHGVEQGAGFGSPSVAQDEKGQIWFPTSRGLVCGDPKKLWPDFNAPRLTVRSVLSGGHEYRSFPVRIPAGSSNLEIHFQGINLRNPEGTAFKYRLRGFEESWVDAGSRTEAYFTNLPPGAYHFQLMGRNGDGIWTTAPLTVAITLEPSFHQTLAARISLTLLLGVMILGLLRILFLKSRQKKAELEKLVSKRTDELSESHRHLQESNHKLTHLNHEMNKLSIVARHTDNAVIICDAEGRIEWVNPSFERIYGFGLEALIRHRGSLLSQITSTQHIDLLIKRCRDERRAVVYESSAIDAQGETIWTQTTLSPVLDSTDEITHLIAIDSDITRIKRWQEELLHKTRALQEATENAETARRNATRANQAKSEFLARMSHEIRTPLNGVIGFCDLLTNTPLAADQKEYTQAIQRSGEILISILDDILDFSKVEAGEMRLEMGDFDPEMTLFDVCEIISSQLAEKPVELLLDIGYSVPALVRGDAGRFRQVLTNLLGNAVKFTQMGEIEASLRVEESRDDRILLHTRIRDTGIGIPEEMLDLIFNAFQQAEGSTTRRFGGTGLGLSISRQLARLMNGQVWAESTPGEGSTFHFTAWLNRSRQPPRPVVWKDLAGKRALIVDDSERNREILESILKKAGMEVRALGRADEVIPSLAQGIAHHKPFDIGIIDIHMPGKGGDEVAREIRSLQDPIAQIPLLAYASAVNRQSAYFQSVGFNGFLPKPVRRDKLLRVISRLLGIGDPELTSPVEMVTQHSVGDEGKQTMHLLLAEDNPINQKLARYMLEKAGYRLSLADNGQEVVDLVTQQPLAFDLILMDLEMPLLNGWEATRILRDRGLMVPIVAMTAASMPGDRESCLEAGMNDHITKPIKRAVVLQMIKTWCRGKFEND
jgi:PAS domain S-box-containing protein